MPVPRLLLAPALAATLLLGTYSGVALAAQPEQDSQQCTAMRGQLAALQADLAAAIADGKDATTLQSQVRVTLGLVEQNCPAPSDEPDPTTDPEPTTDTPAPTTEPEPTQPGDPDDGVLPVYYENCAAAIEAGVAPIVLANGEPGYRPALDSNGNGVACEADESDAGGPDPTTGPSTGSGTDNSGTLGGSSSSGSGSGSIDSTPRGSIDTGYVAG